MLRPPGPWVWRRFLTLGLKRLILRLRPTPRDTQCTPSPWLPQGLHPCTPFLDPWAPNPWLAGHSSPSAGDTLGCWGSGPPPHSLETLQFLRRVGRPLRCSSSRAQGMGPGCGWMSPDQTLLLPTSHPRAPIWPESALQAPPVTHSGRARPWVSAQWPCSLGGEDLTGRSLSQEEALDPTGHAGRAPEPASFCTFYLTCFPRPLLPRLQGAQPGTHGCGKCHRSPGGDIPYCPFPQTHTQPGESRHSQGSGRGSVRPG